MMARGPSTGSSPAPGRRAPATASGADAPGAPLVSVVIPCYADVRFLPEAIASAAAQRDVASEIIVVDDGSPTDAVAACAASAGVHCVRQRNGGLPAARNAGLRASRGAYVVFLDADDRLLAGALAAGVRAMEAHPDAAFVFGEFRFLAEDGTPRERRIRHTYDGDLYCALLKRNHIEMVATVLFRRAVLEAEGGFLTSLRAGEDYELVLRLARTRAAYPHATLVAEYRRYGAAGNNMSGDPARMLHHTMRVLRAQRAHARTNAPWAAALRTGTRFFQDYYGGELIERIRGETHDGAWARAAADLIVLARNDPRGMARRVARRARHAIDIVRGMRERTSPR